MSYWDRPVVRNPVFVIIEQSRISDLRAGSAAGDLLRSPDHTYTAPRSAIRSAGDVQCASDTCEAVRPDNGFFQTSVVSDNEKRSRQFLFN